MRGFPTGWPLARSHTRTVSSALVVTAAARTLRTVHATAATAELWPVRGSPTGWPLARSHTRTVRFELPVTATARPLRSEHATAVTAPVWLAAFGSGVGEPATGLPVLVRLERFTHKLHAHQGVTEAGGVPDGDLDTAFIAAKHAVS